MNIKELHYILCIAKHQNLSKAAQELYVSQPTLSKYLQKLESDLDCKLFSRIDNRYLPTHIGSRYLEYARKMLLVNQDWERELSDLTSYSEGELNIAVPPMRSSCMIPSILVPFSAKYPNIHVNFLEEASGVQETLLQNHQIDFAIFNVTSHHPKLTYELLGEEEILLILSPHHPLAAFQKEAIVSPYPYLDLSLFSKEPFILHYPDQTTGRIALELFKKYKITPPVPFHTRNTQAAVLLVLEGLGSCFAPKTYMDHLHFNKKPLCFSLGAPKVCSSLSIAYQKGAYLPAYALDFIQIAKRMF